MPKCDFKKWFCELTGNVDPFPWQEALYRRFMDNTVERALDIPTGLGKTAMMAAWLLARADGAAIPRRLVYVVDRRAVVDQATEVAEALRAAVERCPPLALALKLNGRPLPISTLRGQHVDNKQWLEDPSSPAIVVGTIDMIGSRLLFEGYGVSRKMRPYHAGFLGADTLIVLDEAHLVPPFEMLLDAIASNTAGVAPRGAEARKIVPQFKLMALSATGRIRTGRPFSLTDQDLRHAIVRRRLDAQKRLRLRQLKATGDLPRARLGEILAKKLARIAWIVAGRGTRTVRVIVFCDKRKVAEKAKKTLEELAKAAGQTDIKERTELFVGGRRVREREDAAEKLRALGFIARSKIPVPKPVFLFATSAGEVGVDLDADHMISDLVEWERMVQRLGRVNRRGEGDAQVVVLLEPDPKPGKTAKAALAVDSEKREGKDAKAIEDHQQRVELARAKRKPFDHLPHYDDGRINASPGAIRELKARADGDANLRAILDAATTPERLRPALTRPIVDAWSMTSLKEHAGRPEIGPWLRGWTEDDPPQTRVVWRTHLPSRVQGRVTRKEIEAFFQAAPPHTSETLETETSQVIDWLVARANAFLKQSKGGDDTLPLHENEVLGFILSPAEDVLASPFDNSRYWLEFGDFQTEDKKQLSTVLAGGTLILRADLGGLSGGLLDASEKQAPRTADDGQDWLPPLDGEPVIRFRIRSIVIETPEPLPAVPQWRTRLRFATTVSEDGEASGWLLVEKWRSDSSTEEDRAVGHCQLLEDHQKLAAARAHELADRLTLPKQYAEMLTIAARLHDEGKRATRWQRAFNAPSDGVYAKTRGPINIALLDGYRHEFGSLGVAARDTELLGLPTELQELALHLIAANHGYGRPVIGVGGCEDAPPSKFEARSTDVALRYARLQQRWGPWGLAWWESLLRAVDHRASQENEASDADGGWEMAQ